MMNFNIGRWNNPMAAVDQIKQIVASAPLVSLTPIDHRFAYLYEQPIAELAWPRDVDDLPADVEYFCFMRHPSRHGGKARSGPRPNLDHDAGHVAVRVGRSRHALRRAPGAQLPATHAGAWAAS